MEGARAVPADDFFHVVMSFFLFLHSLISWRYAWIKALGNGFLAGNRMRTVCFSEAFIALAFRPFMGIIGAVHSPERAGKDPHPWSRRARREILLMKLLRKGENCG